MKTINHFLQAALVLAALTACADYDNGYEEKKLAYEKSFKELFGEIDPNQDWNLASRGSVTVNVDAPSNVKIYALYGGIYSLVGDYTDVVGSQSLGIDLKEGTTQLMVSDGMTAQKTIVGGSVSFSTSRAAHYGAYDPITGAVEGEPDEDDLIISEAEAEKVKYYTPEEVNAWKVVLPEIAWNESNGLTAMETRKLCNLNKVVQDFTFVSTGDFYIYPLYFQTNQTNTIGFYIKDSGGVINKADAYTIKSGDEMQFVNWGAWSVFSSDPADEKNRREYDYISAGYNDDNFKPAVWEEQVAQSDGTYVQKVYVNGVFTDATTINEGDKYLSMTTAAQARSYSYQNVTMFYTSNDEDHPVDFLRLKVKPIKVHIPVGTVFGMYISPTASTTYYSQSSLNSDPAYILGYNDDGSVSQSKTTTSPTKKASHASFFELDGVTYLGFEDWGNASGNSDMDLNDFMCIIDGAIPVVTEQDDKNSSWIIACEDLGNTDDVDFNDVVVKIDHVSGRSTATLTPLAAGGSLASTVAFAGTPLGEIHDLLGNSEVNEEGDHVFINTYSRGNAGRQKTIDVPKDFTLDGLVLGGDNLSAGLTSMGGFTITTSGSQAVTITAPSAGTAPQMICVPAVWQRKVHDNGDGTERWIKGEFAWATERTPIGTGQSTAENISDQYAYATTGHGFSDWVSNAEGWDWYMYPSGSTVSTNSTEYDVTPGGGGGGSGSDPVTPDPYAEYGAELTNCNISGVSTWKHYFAVSEIKSIVPSGNVVLTFVCEGGFNGGCKIHLQSEQMTGDGMDYSTSEINDFTKISDKVYQKTFSIDDLNKDYVLQHSANGTPTLRVKAAN